jgi:hypothetical protein
MTTAAYASATLSMASLQLRRLCADGTQRAKTRGLEPRSRQNVIGHELSLRMAGRADPGSVFTSSANPAEKERCLVLGARVRIKANGS